MIQAIISINTSSIYQLILLAKSMASDWILLSYYPAILTQGKIEVPLEVEEDSWPPLFPDEGNTWGMREAGGLIVDIGVVAVVVCHNNWYQLTKNAMLIMLAIHDSIN